MNPIVTQKMTVYGEGSVAPQFMGSVYMKETGESQGKADWRFGEAMKSMGFEWLGEVPQKDK